MLIIDDEPLVLRLMGRTLGKLHDVTLSSTREAALEVIRRGERFEIILCDLVLPGMSGADFCTGLHAVAPDQLRRVVIHTGAEPNREDRFYRIVDGRFLPKPAALVEVANVVASMVESCGRAA